VDSGNTSAVISAVAGISGGLLGGLLTAFKEWMVSRSSRRKDTVYLAIVLISHLDRFANGCSSVAHDDGTLYGAPARPDGEHEVTTEAPVFQPLDLDVNWKVLPKGLLYSILRLPDQREQISNALSQRFEFDFDPPEHTEFFWARRRDYAELGLRASQIAKQLKKLAGIPLEEHKEDEWDRDRDFRAVIEEIDGKRAAQLERLRMQPLPGRTPSSLQE